MSRWTKKAAIARMQSNIRLAEITRIDPRIQFFIDQAIHYKFTSPYDPLWVYQTLRNNIQNWVGLHAELPELRNADDYYIVIDALDDLLDSPQSSHFQLPEDPSKSHWTKEAAITRMNSNKRLAEIIQVEPRIIQILEQAIHHKTTSLPENIEIYTIMRNELNNLVGRNAADPSIRSDEDHDTVLDTILDLLNLTFSIYIKRYMLSNLETTASPTTHPQKELSDGQI